MRCSIYTCMVYLGSALIGGLFALISVKYGSLPSQYSAWKKSKEMPIEERYRVKLLQSGLRQTHQNNIQGYKIVPESEYLMSTNKLLCWVVLNGDGKKINSNWYVRTLIDPRKAIADTWGKHCAKILFFTNKQTPSPDDIYIEAPDPDSWTFTYKVIMHIASKGYLDQYDWFLKTEEDTYVIIENLLYFLSVRNSTSPSYLGHTYTKWSHDYNSKSAYVISKAAYRKLLTILVKGHCPSSSIGEDEGLGECFAGVGVRTEDTRDILGRGRFLLFHPETLLNKGNMPWSDTVWPFTKYPSPEGPNCCSDEAITFHDISPNMMYILHYLVYRLKPYGISSNLVLPLENLTINSTPQGQINKYNNLLKT